MRDAGQPQAVVGEHVHVVLQVLADLAMVRALEPRPQRGKRRVEVKLFGHAGIAVRERDVAGLQRLDRQRDADQARRHRIERGRFSVDAGEVRGADALQPCLELRARRDRLVLGASLALGHSACGRCTGRGRRRTDIHLPQPRLELVALIDLAQARRVLVTHCKRRERRDMRGKVAVGLDRDQRLRRRYPRQRLAQVFAHHAGDLIGVFDERVERTVGLQPFGCGLRPHLVDARHIVDAVADQRQVVDDSLGRHSELGRHARHIECFAAHRVDQRRALVDQLCQVLVAGRDHGPQAMVRRLPCERPDHVVGLDAFDLDDGPAHGVHCRMDRLDLRDQIVRHGGPIGLVFGVQVVPEGLTLGIEHARDVVGRHLLAQHAQHGDEPAQRSGRLARRRTQIGQRVIRAIQVARPIEQ